jgi:hypothetical protein
VSSTTPSQREISVASWVDTSTAPPPAR